MQLLKIKELSHKKNVTLKDIATHSEMTYQNLNRCINENKIQASVLERIAQFLNVPISYFFDGEDNGLRVGDVQHNNNTVVINGEATTIAGLIEKVKGLKRECEEKEKQIELLREMNEMLKNK